MDYAIVLEDGQAGVFRSEMMRSAGSVSSIASATRLILDTSAGEDS
jgi:hypothetical protein